MNGMKKYKTIILIFGITKDLITRAV